MALQRTDYDQAARYLKYACETLERETPAQSRSLRGVLELAIRRLSPGDYFVGDAAAEITVLRDLADKVLVSHARTEILKAVVVLRDRSGR